MKKGIIFAAVCLVSILLIVSAAAAESITGACGANTSFSLDGNGIMTISGSGKMWDFRSDADYFDFHPCPWEDYRQSIREVVFQKGITRIGADSFNGCKELTKVTFSDSITDIGEFAFCFCDQLGDFTLPNGLEKIGQQAFCGTAITRIEIPGSVGFVDAGICEFCSRLSKVVYKKHTEGNFVSGNSPFRGCTALKAIEVETGHNALVSDEGVLYQGSTLLQYPAGKEAAEYTVRIGCTDIGQFSFYETKALEKVYLPRKTEALWPCAFGNCKNLTYVKMPDTVKTISKGAFEGCSQLQVIDYAGSEEDWKAIDIDPIENDILQTVQINYNVTAGYEPTISTGKCGKNVTYSFDNGTLTLSGSGATWDFRNDGEEFDYHPCPWQDEKDRILRVVVKKGITDIGADAFAGCINLKEVTLPNTLKTLRQFAFNYCSSLADIVLPRGLQVLKQGAFQECENLSHIMLPLSLQRIEFDAFRFSEKIKTVEYEGSKADWEKIVIEFNNESLTSAKIKYNVSYSSEDPAPTAPENSTPVVGGLKYKLSGSKAIVTGPKSRNAKKLTIPNTIKVSGKTYKVTEIKAGAFKDMKKLTAVTIGENVKTIGKSAFQNCEKLKTITIKTKKLTSSSVKSNAFKGIYKKAVFKCPKDKAADYKKILLKKGAPKTCKFK